MKFILKISFMATLTCMALAIGPSYGLAQDSGPSYIPPEIRDAVNELQDEAQTHFSKAFSELDDSEYIKTSDVIEQLLRDYGNLDITRQAYFYLADIYANRLQGRTNCLKAIDTLRSFVDTFRNSNDVLDAWLAMAIIYYRNLNDIDSAIGVLQEYFDNLQDYQYLESQQFQAQVILAKCFQKKGSFANENKIWSGLTLTNPGLDRTGRARFLAGIADWKRLPGQRAILYFHSNIPENTYRKVLNTGESILGSLAAKFAGELPGPMEIYLYTDDEDMFAHTSSKDPMVLGLDREIHLSPAQIDQMQYLVPRVFSFALNSRPRSDLLPMLASGFDNAYFMTSSGEAVDSLAAGHLLLFKESPRASLLTRPNTFFGTAEYQYLAGSFVKYLLEHEPASDFRKIYKGLYPTHQPGMIDDAFKKAYGKSLDDLVKAWYTSLGPEIARVRTDVGHVSYNIVPVTVDLSTPEAALETWFQALRMGDFDAMIKSSAPDLKQILQDAKKAYEDEGILNEVTIESFVYPYYHSSYEITNFGKLDDDNCVYWINILKDTKVMEEKQVPMTRIGGKWYIDVEPS